ncbi:MAG: DUF2975 domain-containing protein [Proteobacteria bacterium]|nr:DUF2975 domain-containing protein [Pseudomonadota bacterium]
MSSINTFSAKLAWLFKILFFMTPLFTLFYWLNIEPAFLLAINPFGIPKGHYTFNFFSKLLGFGISLIPTILVMILIYKLSKLFNNYAKGIVFNKDNVKYYKQLGQGMFVLAFINFLSPALLSLALSFQNPPGTRFISLSLGTPQLFPILVGLVIIGISYVMEKAHQLEEDAQHII